MSVVRAITVVTALLVAGAVTVAIMLITYAQAASTYDGTEVWKEWVQAYKVVADLSQKGINTTQYIITLKESLNAILRKDYQRAQEIIDKLTPRLQGLQANIQNYAISVSIEKGTAIATFISIPFLVYWFLPRTCLTLWYWTRKGWSVRITSLKK